MTAIQRRFRRSADARGLARAALLAALLLAGAAVPPAAAELQVTRALAARFARQPRATVTLERRAPPGGAASAAPTRAGLALEVPDRALLEFPATGERVAMRGDGGEWLQPELRQMVRLDAAQAAAARRWWAILLPGAGARFAERALGGGRWAVTALEAPGDTAVVTLDAAGLPSSLALDDGSGTRVTWTLRGWAFGAARGPEGYRLRAPAGYEVVDLP
jgi:hypothetical protein